MDISARIQNYRKERGLSQEQLADAVSVSRQAVSKWESGQSQPDIDRLISLSRVFDVSLDALLTGADPTLMAVPDEPDAEPEISEDDELGQTALDFSIPDGNDDDDGLFYAAEPGDRSLLKALAVGAAAGAVAIVGVSSLLRFLFKKRT